jgi:hypothetical protein
MIIDSKYLIAKPRRGVIDLKSNVIPSGFIFNQIFSGASDEDGGGCDGHVLFLNE